MIPTILNTLQFLFVAIALYTGYKLYKKAQSGANIREDKNLLYSFISSIACIWIINIITGFII